MAMEARIYGDVRGESGEKYAVQTEAMPLAFRDALGDGEGKSEIDEIPDKPPDLDATLLSPSLPFTQTDTDKAFKIRSLVR